MNNESRDIQYGQIIEREFRKAAKLPVEARVSVAFDDDEEIITVNANGDFWMMQVGSDDDFFFFEKESETNEEFLQFDFPQDWIDLEESNG